VNSCLQASFDEAKALCEGRQMNLLSIETAAEKEQIGQYLKSQSMFSMILINLIK